MKNPENVEMPTIQTTKEKKVAVDVENKQDISKAFKLVKKLEKERKKINFPSLHATQLPGESLDVLVLETNLGVVNIINPRIVGLSSKVNFKFKDVSFKPYKSIQIQGMTFGKVKENKAEELTFVRLKIQEKNLAFLTQFSLLDH